MRRFPGRLRARQAPRSRIRGGGEDCLSEASSAALTFRDWGKGTRRAAPGRPWFWILLPKQKDLAVRGRTPARTSPQARTNLSRWLCQAKRRCCSALSGAAAPVFGGCWAFGEHSEAERVRRRWGREGSGPAASPRSLACGRGPCRWPAIAGLVPSNLARAKKWSNLMFLVKPCSH